MRISIFGLGYVGSVSAACLAEAGHEIIGVDINPTKVDLMNQGLSPVIEKDLDELIKKGVSAKRIRAMSVAEEAVLSTDLSLICVGTPSKPNSSLNLDFVSKVCEEIGSALKRKKGEHTICVRSTVIPGSTTNVVVPSLERGFGGKLPSRFRIAVNPEFLREGAAVSDFSNPPKTVVGADDAAAAEKVLSLYEGIDAPVFRTSIEAAEMAKYVDNVFHALKIAFANEIGAISRAVGVDSYEVMNIFCADTKLNISPAYLKPGFAFGGSCLPKDLRALLYKSRSMDIDVPLISAVLPSNDMQIQRAVEIILSGGKKRLAFLGLSFKAGTDDLRESPLVRLVENCIGKGYEIRIFDRSVSLARLVGANKAYIEKEIPHISSLMVETLKEALDFADVVIVGHRSPEFSKAVLSLPKGKRVIDLVRVVDTAPEGVDYIGFNW